MDFGKMLEATDAILGSKKPIPGSSKDEVSKMQLYMEATDAILGRSNNNSSWKDLANKLARLESFYSGLA